MKVWKIILVVGLAVLVVGLVTASVYAASIQQSSPYGTNGGIASSSGGYAGGVMRGGMMGGYGYSQYSGNAYGSSSYGRCMGAVSWP